jgi:AcrR family transcriptional regulator
VPEQRQSLRARKKLATRAALAQAAWRLTIERGYAHTRVEDIAAAAGVSTRTFGNYFAGKDEALLFVGAERGRRVTAALRAWPAGADLWEALAAAVPEQFADDGEVAGRSAFPPRLASAQRMLHAPVEAELATAIAERTGTDVRRDLYPRLVAAVVVGAAQTTFNHWRDSGDAAPFPETLRAVLRQVAAGLPIPPPRTGG